MKRNPSIIGIGSYVPDRVLTNMDLERMVDTSDEWIRTRTGIRERRIAPDDVTSSDLGIHSARAAVDDAGIDPQQIDRIVVATATADMPFPATACLIQEALGVENCAAFDISAACSGFIYGLSVVQGQIASGSADTVLLVATETLSRIVDWEDRSTCVLFGDGAASILIQDRPDWSERGIHSVHLGSDGSYKDILHAPAENSTEPMAAENTDGARHYIKMDGPSMFKVAVRKMKSASQQALQEAGMTPSDVDWVIAHQANSRIIESVQKRLGVPDEKMIMNLERYGNTSAASIGLALDEARQDGRIQSGDRILMVAVGGGLTWGAAVITYP